VNDLVWPELVLHVLAHLECTAHLPSSLYDPHYVVQARRQLGPPEARALDRDLAILAEMLDTHERLSQVQQLVLLHQSLESALEASTLELASLGARSGADLQLRDRLLRDCPVAAELLRCAALLEAETFVQWPLPERDPIQSQLDRAMPDFWSVAPWLRRVRVRPLRVLGYRGRAFPDEIWVGIPARDMSPALVHDSPHEAKRPSLAHVSCQAAHEATVLEVAQRATADHVNISEREVEQVAVALLSRRAQSSKLASIHVEWLQTWAPEVQAWASGEGLSAALVEWLQHLIDTPFALDSVERRP
jgi:hypothetical protein